MLIYAIHLYVVCVGKLNCFGALKTVYNPYMAPAKPFMTLLEGSWDIVPRVITTVTVLTTTYSPT